MGLQVRLIDSLGERLIELEARAANQANVVGRGAEAEVEVPSSGVAKRHCLLFVHEGRWVVQDGGSAAGTFVNGKRLTGPAFVETSDTITLGTGSNPPTLVVDPHHVGVSEASEEMASAPAPRAAPPAPRGVGAPWGAPVMNTAMPAPSLPPPVARPPMAPPQRPGGLPAYVPQGYSPQAGGSQAEEPTGWEDVPPPTEQFYVPKRKGTSGGTIAVFAVLSIGIVIGGVYWIYTVYQKRMANAVPQVIIVKPKEEAKPTSVFDFAKNGKPATTRSVAKVRTGPQSQPMDGSASTEPPPDPRRQDPEWLEIEHARFEEPVLAIVKFNDYLDRMPDTPYKKDLEKYIDEAVDRLWWKRLVELFKERDSAQKEIEDRKTQIGQSQDAEFKKGLEGEIAKFAEQRDRADETIRVQMKFTGQAPPNVYDSQDLAIGRANRDAAYYATWKQQVLATIKHSRGQRLPWRSSR